LVWAALDAKAIAIVVYLLVEKKLFLRKINDNSNIMCKNYILNPDFTKKADFVLQACFFTSAILWSFIANVRHSGMMNLVNKLPQIFSQNSPFLC
jgi:hypothetical protein